MKNWDTDFLRLFLRRPQLQATADGLAFVEANLFQLTQFVPPDSRHSFDFWPEPQNITGVREFVTELLAAIDQRGLLQYWRHLTDADVCVEAEILGAYHCRAQRIDLYWSAIALIALELGVSIESLTVVTLIHELVHAYTHLGQDTDNARWDTTQFIQTHIWIVEGLAQFYTELICKKLEPRHPEFLATFQKLLPFLPDPYINYQSWALHSESRAEVIRFAMIECRKTGIQHFEDFMGAIEETQYRLCR